MGVAMKETLQACERPAEEGENKFCATSLESLVDLSTSKLGSNRLTVLATNVSKIMSKSVRQDYTIVGVKDEGAAEKDVYYWHSKQYAYAVYYSHKSACTLEAGRRIARVWVKVEDGRTVEAVAVCHKDTSAWIPNNIPFKALNVRLGTPSICLFVPQGDHLWQTAD
ncbi:BURP domain-containing protein 3-like [Cryptomeria japonica]|uniref:BURP domain-containing protein 3-like n=1 Tax=Cryptomeria japonica TaxID=3369 RepID=UPI0027DA91DE|nr:BURP domain-containing protein 3-like [Cryptomeria japonica]